MKVVGEGADCVQHTFRIPTGLVLNAFALNGALANQVVDVDGKLASHVVAVARARFLGAMALWD